MELVQKTVKKIDNYQKRHRFFGFIVAVVKKYGEDNAGRHVALLTYYSFLSIFPLLMVLTTITERVAGNNAHLEHTIIHGLTGYFPMLGNQLASHVHGLHSSGLALLIGILFTLYGVRGLAEAFSLGVRDIWGIPEQERDPFPKSALKAVTLIVVGGVGFIAASVIAGLVSSSNHNIAFRVLAALINLAILFLLFNFLINFSLPRHVSLKETWVGAAAAAIGLIVLQVLGNYLVSRELKHLDALYSYFAVALGLLFWLYLQAQVIYYAIEVASVSSKKLWPKSLT